MRPESYAATRHQVNCPCDPDGERVPLWEVEASIHTANRKAAARRTREDLHRDYAGYARWSPELGRLAEPVPAEADDRLDVLAADLDADAETVRPDWHLDLLADLDALAAAEPFAWGGPDEDEAMDGYFRPRARSLRVDAEEEARLYGWAR